MNMNHYLYPKDYDPLIDTFFVNKYFFHSVGTFSVNRHILV